MQSVTGKGKNGKLRRARQDLNASAWLKKLNGGYDCSWLVFSFGKVKLDGKAL